MLCDVAKRSCKGPILLCDTSAIRYQSRPFSKKAEDYDRKLIGNETYIHGDGTKDVGAFRSGKLHGESTRTYVDGSRLQGEFREGKIKGTLRYLSGDVEEGEWVKGNLTGKGKRTNRDGSTLKGEFREGKIHYGKGALRHPDGTVEMGEWVNGDLTGRGKRTYPEGKCKEGTFLNHKLHGQGVITYPDGHHLEGEFRKGKPFNCKGALRHPTGDVEEGAWVEGNLTGKRTYTDGKCEEGTFVDFKLHGPAVVTHPNGHRLEGEFREGKPFNCKGTLCHPTGDVEEGAWVNGDLTGKRSCANGTQQVGTFHKGYLHGQGVVTHTYGHRLEGEFKEGKPFNCKGALRHPDGNVEEGEWVQGSLTGKRTYTEGKCEEGTFVDFKLHGHGVVKHPDGHRLEGEFREGKIYNGNGISRDEHGTEYRGEWLEGWMKGTRTYRDKVLEGIFTPDGRIYNGHGALLHRKGNMEVGEWVEGKFFWDEKKSTKAGVG